MKVWIVMLVILASASGLVQAYMKQNDARTQDQDPIFTGSIGREGSSKASSD